MKVRFYVETWGETQDDAVDLERSPSILDDPEDFAALAAEQVYENGDGETQECFPLTIVLLWPDERPPARFSVSLDYSPVFTAYAVRDVASPEKAGGA